MKKLLSITLLALICTMSFAQNRVTGKVTATDGQTVPFASLVVKGTMNGVATSDDGSYVLENVASNAKLVFSCIGYLDQEVDVAGRSVVNVIMAPDMESLDEVMVIAYGTAKKGTYTGSAAAVNNEKFDLRPVTGVTNALAGTTAGVQVSTSNGMPGSEPTIRIRGIGSFNASNSPLVVLDGMPYDNAVSSYKNEVASLKSDISSHQSDVSQFEVSANYNRLILERTQQMYDKGIVTLRELEDARLNVEKDENQAMIYRINALVLENRIAALQL